MKSEITLVLPIHVDYRMLPPETGTTDEAGRSEIIPGGAEILSVHAENPKDSGKLINITDLLSSEDIETLTEQCNREEGLCL